MEHADAGSWLLISTTTADVVATAVTDALKSHGRAVHHHVLATARRPRLERRSSFENHLRAGGFSGVVILTGPKNGDADDQSPLLGREYVQHLVRIARELPEIAGEPPRLYVVTRNAQTVVAGDVANLEQAGLRGLMRVIGTEHPHLRATQIDVDDDTDAEQLAQQLLGGSEEDETAWRNGQWYAARLCPAPLRPEERQTTVADHERDGMRLQIRTPGDLESLELVAFERVPPGPGTDRGRGQRIQHQLRRCAGRIRPLPRLRGRAAAAGHRLRRSGDRGRAGRHRPPGRRPRRAACPPTAAGRTFVTCDARLAVTLPAGLADEQAAAVTTATRHRLVRPARPGPDQSRRQGADPLRDRRRGTGGDRDRPRRGSRDLRHRRQRAASTTVARHGHRACLRLAQHRVRRPDPPRHRRLRRRHRAQLGDRRRPARGLELLAFGGRFVEIGKRDIYGDTRLGLFPFRRNLTFYAVDLALMSFSHPDRLRDLLRTVYQLIADGVLPVPESTHYPLADAATAIRVMSAAQHTGKLVLDVPRAGQQQRGGAAGTGPGLPPRRRLHHHRRAGRPGAVPGREDGGGRLRADRAVRRARSRRPKALETIERIRAIGADVVVECGDIADPEHRAAALVAAATATGLPVRGVLHAAAVVEDATLTNITDELIDRDWAPKVYGAWNLHTATADQPLDWFCSFSSAAALVGSPGQGAYAAANSWLDAFTHWRRAQGLPATAIAWGAWAEIGPRHRTGGGHRRRHHSRRGRVRVRSAAAPRPRLHRLRADHGHPVVGRLRRSAARSPKHSAPPGKTPTAQANCVPSSTSCPPDEWPARLRRLISDQVSLILRRNVDPGPAALRVRPGLAGHPGTAHPHRDRNGVRIYVHRHHHHYSRFGGLLCEKLAPAEAADVEVSA